MSEHPPVSPEVQELLDEQEAERQHLAQSRRNLERVQYAQGGLIQAQANVLNAVAWLITMAWLLGAAVVITQVIL